jgi:hypothetical protein
MIITSRKGRKREKREKDLPQRKRRIKEFNH